MRRHIGTGWGMPWNVVRGLGGGKGTSGLWDGTGFTGAPSGMPDPSDHTHIAFFYAAGRGAPHGRQGEGR